ncbi:hypothetical protein GIB67_033783 [Kingdonia uniflora]|uniref:Protein kinase domain-containing protein n=1 Tax=Kingdonia uniflora TaxID=39325 RepID=A0A7J7P4A2_9MAGN|nr:hypothetical protein GIB67_033783 [Kingdonia uniflora]
MFFQLLICLFSLLTFASAAPLQPKSGCQSTCGDVSIPYPFGIGVGCYQNSGLALECNKSTTSPRLLLGNIPVRNISLLSGTMTIAVWVSFDCYNKDGTSSRKSGLKTTLSSLFTFSDTRNKLTAVGCDTNAIMSDRNGNIFQSGCMSVCANERSVVGGSCSGVTSISWDDRLRIAAETAHALAYLHSAPIIHRDIKSANILLDDNFTAKVADFGISKLVQLGQMQMSTLVQGTVGYLDPEYFNTSQLTEKSDVFSFGVVLVELLTGKKHVCSERPREERGLATYFNAALKANRLFQLVEPQVIDEGKSAQIMAYSDLAKRCLHMKGEERPTMKEAAAELEGLRRFEMSPQQNEENMSLLSEPQNIYSIELSSCTGDSSGQFSMEVMPMNLPPRQVSVILNKQAMFFQLLICLFSLLTFASAAPLQPKSGCQSTCGNVSIPYPFGIGVGCYQNSGLALNCRESFTPPRLLSGTVVVRNISLSGTMRIAVLVSFDCYNKDRTSSGKFSQEMTLPKLFTFSHNRNKFTAVGTDTEHLHGKNLISSISWEDRLRICKEIAGALAYLHSSLCTPIFHRDIKSSNILLDENFKAKVSDFGISRSVPYEQTHLSTLVRGTFGYLDPEYFHSGQFTEKSDVYGFGVVLVEVLTGQKPISFTRSEEEANLAMQFISSVKEDRVLQILETRIANEARKEEIQIVASLAKKCLKLVGKKRPTMTEVLIQLENLRVFQHQESLRLLTQE